MLCSDKMLRAAIDNFLLAMICFSISPYRRAPDLQASTQAGTEDPEVLSKHSSHLIDIERPDLSLLLLRNIITPKGQFTRQLRHPMHLFSSESTTSASSDLFKAPDGHELIQGAGLQW